MSEIEPLAPCPFCGTIPEFSYVTREKGITVKCWNVECAIHGFSILRERWNTRQERSTYH